MEKICQKITNRGAWVGEQIKNNDEWICHLSRDAVSDIENALEYAKSNNVQIPFAKSDFPISIAATEINNSVEEVLKGRGYTLIRGIEIERYNQHECEMIYWGIGTHIGKPVSQNRKGHTLGHVRDQGLSTDDPDVRLYQTASQMDFHADFLPVDVLGLFCLKKAQKGGLSHVVSSLTIHNIMLEERPDLLEVAYKNFYIDWRGEEGPGELPYISVPMFSVEKGILSSRIPSRIYVRSCERFGPEFKITQKQSGHYVGLPIPFHNPCLLLYVLFSVLFLEKTNVFISLILFHFLFIMKSSKELHQNLLEPTWQGWGHCTVDER